MLFTRSLTQPDGVEFLRGIKCDDCADNSNEKDKKCEIYIKLFKIMNFWFEIHKLLWHYFHHWNDFLWRWSICSLWCLGWQQSYGMKFHLVRVFCNSAQWCSWWRDSNKRIICKDFKDVLIKSLWLTNCSWLSSLIVYLDRRIVILLLHIVLVNFIHFDHKFDHSQC